MKHHCKNFIFLLLVQTSFLYSRNYTPQEFEKLNSDQQAIVLTDKNCQIIPEHINPNSNAPDKEQKIVVSHIEYAPIEGLNNNHNIFNNSSPHSNEFKTSHSLDSHYNNYAHNTHSNHSMSFNVTYGNAREIPDFSVPMKQISDQSILAEASISLQNHFCNHTTPHMYAATIKNPNHVIPGYTSPHGLYDHLDELSQFAYSDPAITQYLISRMKSYYGRIENVLFDKKGLSHEFFTRQHQVALIFIYADFLKEFYCHKAHSVFYRDTCDNRLVLQYINFINWNQYNNFNYTADERTRAMRYAGSLNGNYGVALAALEAGDSEKAYTLGNQRVKTQYPGKYVGNLWPTEKEASTFELYPDLKKITLEHYLADKAKAEQEKAKEEKKRAIKTNFFQKNATKWCENYKDDNPYLPNDVLQQRHQAAQRSKTAAISHHKYVLSSEQAKHIDPQLLNEDKTSLSSEGSPLHHQIIRESIRVIGLAIDPYYIVTPNHIAAPTSLAIAHAVGPMIGPCTPEKITDTVLDFANASLFSNKQGNHLASSHILDACWAFLDFRKQLIVARDNIIEGVADGVCAGVDGFGHALVAAGCFIGKALLAFGELGAVEELAETHPHVAKELMQDLAKKSALKDTCDAVSHAACAVGNTAYAVGNAMYISAELEAAADLCDNDWRAGQEELERIGIKLDIPALIKYAETVTKRDIARIVTQFAVETLLLHKTTQFIGFLAKPSKPAFMHCVGKGIEAGKTPITAEVISTGVKEVEVITNTVKKIQHVNRGATVAETITPVTKKASKLPIPSQKVSVCANDIKVFPFFAEEAEVLANEAELLTNNIKNTQPVVSSAKAAKTTAQTTEELSKISAATEGFSSCAEEAEALMNNVKTAQQVITGSTEVVETLIQITEETAELLRTFNIAKYDTSIGNLQKLEEALTKFRNIPGTLTKDGPLFKVLKFGQKTEALSNTKLDTVYGAMYEVEKGLSLIEAGEEIIEFGQSIGAPNIAKREFDIITKTKLIECKNWDWSKTTAEKLKKFKSTICQQKQIASVEGKIFELHSKRAIPTDLKTWLYEKKINFVEDML